MHCGLEIAVLILMAWDLGLSWMFMLCTFLSAISWLYAPWIYNPHQFDSFNEAFQDFKDWFNWMCGPDEPYEQGNPNVSDDKAWSAWAVKAQVVRCSASFPL